MQLRVFNSGLSSNGSLWVAPALPECYDLSFYVPRRNSIDRPWPPHRHSLADHDRATAAKTRQAGLLLRGGAQGRSGPSGNPPQPELVEQLKQCDGFVLPGSPEDVEPRRYGAARHPQTKWLDPHRDTTDTAILEHALGASKPVLAICYGCQNLNVSLGGTLYQDIPSELHSSIEHSRNGLPRDAQDPTHAARIAPGSELGQLAAAAGLPRSDGGYEVQVNTSHHQAVRDLGRGLRVAALAPDGVIEAIEHEPHKHWVVGVQWHPERMAGHALSESLFSALVEATRAVSVRR